MATLLLAALAATLPLPASAQVDLGALQDEAVEWLRRYIRINTVNPPGNETTGIVHTIKDGIVIYNARLMD